MRYHGKVVLVNSGSKGIGLAAAPLFTPERACVANVSGKRSQARTGRGCHTYRNTFMGEVI